MCTCTRTHNINNKRTGQIWGPSTAFRNWSNKKNKLTMSIQFGSIAVEARKELLDSYVSICVFCEYAWMRLFYVRLRLTPSFFYFCLFRYTLRHLRHTTYADIIAYMPFAWIFTFLKTSPWRLDRWGRLNGHTKHGSFASAHKHATHTYT